MPNRRTIVRRIIAVLAVCVAVGLGLAIRYRPWVGKPPVSNQQSAIFPIPPYTKSRYLNTGLDAKFIGTAACAECHKSNHESYLLTAHSRALSDLDANAEPPDGSFHHGPSGRTYRAYRKGNELHHEELLRTADGTEIARLDFPVKYLIGSGHFTRSYLVEVDGFLHESPITWYEQKKKWAMSPGYDAPQHWSFERPVRIGCVHCHAGRVELVGDTVHRMTIHEKTIGCESCHGPGSLHADAHRPGKRLTGEEDPTIVNPGRLPRDRLEAICSVCHLSGTVAVLVRGRRETDFRPGMPLTDYRIDYHLDSAGEQMTVVGHMQQLRLSRCYQKTDMTCLTCHDPHAREKPKDPIKFYRQKCLSCHESKGCSVPVADRRKKELADNCSACHMPRGDTDIPHVAFTHHRIGNHSSRSPAPERGSTPELVPAEDVWHFTPLERQRNLGIAYFRLSKSEVPGTTQYQALFSERAQKLLEGVYTPGQRDGMTVVALAECEWRSDPARSADYAREALTAPDLSAESRSRALIVLADYHLRESDYPAAIGVLEQLVHMRRFTDDWRLLGAAYLSDRQPEKAVNAFRQALAIRPTRPDVHRALAAAYFQLGDQTKSQEHRQKAEWLLRNRQD